MSKPSDRNDGTNLRDTKGILLLHPTQVINEVPDPNQLVGSRLDLGGSQRQQNNFFGTTQSVRNISPYEMINTTDKKLTNTLGNTRNFLTPTTTRNLTPSQATTTRGISPTKNPQQSIRQKIIQGPIIPVPGTIVHLPNGSVVTQGIGQSARVPSFRSGTQTTPTRSRLVLTPQRNTSPLPYNQQMRLDNAMRKSHEEIQDVLGDTLYDQTNKMQSEIDFLAQQLKTRDQEVSMYTNYLDNLRQAVNKRPIISPSQSPAYVAPTSQVYQPTAYYPSTQPSYLRGRQYSPLYTRNQYEPYNYSPRDYELDDYGRKELRDQQILNQQQLQTIQNLEINYGELKRQLEERDSLIGQQQDEILKYQGKYLYNRKGEEESADKIRRLEQENELCQLKIDNLEKNLNVLEKEYRYLKDVQSPYPSYS